MASSDRQIEAPKRAELLDVNINTGAQNINTERALTIYKLQLTTSRFMKSRDCFL